MRNPLKSLDTTELSVGRIPILCFLHPSGTVLVSPLFRLYDNRFGPSSIRFDELVAWAAVENSVGSDGYMLNPDPFPDSGAWCESLCMTTAARLDSCPTDLPKILVKHFLLEEKSAVLPEDRGFATCSDARRTHGWRKRFKARTVVFGRVHLLGTWWIDGVPFQEVSLGYPSPWDRGRGVGADFREVTLAPNGVVAK